MAASLLALALSAAPALGETVRDEFNAISYAGDNGTLSWSGPWQELGELNGPTSGRVRVLASNRCAATNCLRIGGAGVDINGRGAEREADLSGTPTATLTFHRRLQNNSSGSIILSISSDGGGSWTVLRSFPLTGSQNAFNETIDISAWASANTRIRFLGSGSNVNAYLYLDNAQIEYFPGPPHFAIAHDGSGVTCHVEEVAISAHTGAHAVDVGYTGEISISTSTAHGDWSLLTGAGALVNLGNGTGSYVFDPADGGQVTLGFLSTFGETLNVHVTDGTRSEDAAEDPDLTVTGGATGTFRDEFGAVSYANQDGTESWSGDWIEVDAAGAGPGAGNARVSGDELVLEDYPDTGIDTSVEREANLAAFSSATFSFDFRTTFRVDANDSVFVEVSDDGGASWALLENITGITGSFSGSRSYDVTPYRTPNTRVRFRVNGLNGSGGTICCYGDANEEFRADDVKIAVDGPAFCGPDHFSIEHDGSAVNCQAERVTITAHDLLHAVDPTYTGAIAISTSTEHGDWSLVSGSGTLANAGGGRATYSYEPSDAGVVVLGLRDTFSETLEISVSDGAVVEDPFEDPDLLFASTGFSFLADGLASAIGSQIGGKPSNLAPGAQLLELEAVRTSDLTGACEAALQGANPIELAFTCVDPATCAGTRVSVNGVDVTPNHLGSPLVYIPVDLDFGDETDSTAPLVIAFPDVGLIQLHARYALTPSGEDLLGASNAFVVRPFAFEITAPGNPGGILPTGPIFTSAGADFDAGARAVLWQAADDTDGDGRADGHGDLLCSNNAPLADNLPAISYGREAAPEAVLLAANLVEPAGGVDPGLGGATTIAAFAAGSGSTPAVFFDEVGIAELLSGVADGDYLGLGAASTAGILGRSGALGRFTPDHLDVVIDTAPVFQTGCDTGGFTYTGQPFVYAQAPVLRVTARSARNTQTANYTATWWKLTSASLGGPTYASDPGAPAGLDTTGLLPAGTDPLIVDLGDGSGTLTFDAGAGLRFDRSAPVGPFDAEIALSIDVQDGDAVVYAANPFQIGAPASGAGIAFTTGKEMRYGRVAIENAYGSELTALAVPLRAEYFEGTGFVPNREDGCTSIAASNVGTTARSPVALATAPSVAKAPLLAGDAGLALSAPGQAGTADLLVNLDGPDVGTPWGVIISAGLAWLQYDWTTGGAGPPDQNPAARASFGIYAGQRPVIFRRELY
jgi:hypothetical protein